MLAVNRAKANVYNTYAAPQAVYRSLSGAYVSQTERAYSL